MDLYEGSIKAEYNSGSKAVLGVCKADVAYIVASLFILSQFSFCLSFMGK